jgi:hypothetical protein
MTLAGILDDEATAMYLELFYKQMNQLYDLFLSVDFTTVFRLSLKFASESPMGSL